jgi:hypothetical protein
MFFKYKCIGIALCMLLSPGLGHSGSYSFNICGNEISKGKNVNIIKKEINEYCKITDDGQNLYFKDTSDESIANLSYKNNKVTSITRYWDRHASNQIEEINALISAFENLTNDKTGTKAVIYTHVTQDPTYSGKDLIIYIGGRKITISTHLLIGSKYPPAATISETLE